jgi:hypothetical protein
MISLMLSHVLSFVSKKPKLKLASSNWYNQSCRYPSKLL